jgi:hypothetical protein
MPHPCETKVTERPRLDLVSEPLTAGKLQAVDKATRPFVGVQFDCCSLYTRIYCNAAGTAFVGNCPRCARKIEIKITADGSSSRFFTAS